MILNILHSDITHLPHLKQVIDSCELFPSEYLDGMMNDFFTNPESADRWLTVNLDDATVGIVYYAPERLTEGTYNLYLIAVHKDYHAQGLGSQIMAHVETILRNEGNRVLIVETSGLPEFELTRKFYDKCGYDREAVIRDFYKEGEDKVVFWKKLR
jgi:ribosomal protein S18 acetylase RimI-like enzyme